MDFSNHKFRCSSLGAIMTNQQGKKDTKTLEEISETAKGELVKIFIHVAYGRDKEIKSKYIEKGLAVEEDSITLLSRIKERFFKKNDQRFENDFLSGEPDITDPLYDTKSCWDLHTFYEAKVKPLKKDYAYQMLGYTALLQKEIGTIAFCLIDTPLALIELEKDRLFYKMGVATKENPEYLEAAEALEKEMTFGDIPVKEKLHEVEVKTNPEEILKVYDRILLCRDWLNEFVNKTELVNL